MAVKYLSGNRLWGTDAERLALTTYTATQNSWKYIDSQKLDGTDSTIELDFSSGTKQNIMVLIAWARDSGTNDPKLQLGGDAIDQTDTVYAQRGNHNSGTDFKNDSDDDCNFVAKWATGTGSGVRNFEVHTFSNYAGGLKLGESISAFGGTTGADNAPNLLMNVFAYNKTDGQVGYISYGASDAGYTSNTVFSDDSEIVILGCDDSTSASADDNFWEELGQYTLTEAGDTIDSGTFTAKKYLWFEAWTSGDNTEATFRFNNIATETYASGRDNDGTFDEQIEQEQAKCNASGDAQFGTYTIGYVYNVAGQEKMCVTTQIASEGEDGTKPRRATTATRWVETTNPITSIQMINMNAGGDFAIGSRIRVWGGSPP